MIYCVSTMLVVLAAGLGGWEFAEAGGLEEQLGVLAGIARSVAGAELMARAGGFLSNEHGLARAENGGAIRGVDYTMSRTRGAQGA